MTDQVTITIDCDEQLIEVRGPLSHPMMDRQIQTSRAELIAELLMPHIREMMACSTEELMQRNLRLLKDHP